MRVSFYGLAFAVASTQPGFATLASAAGPSNGVVEAAEMAPLATRALMTKVVPAGEKLIAVGARGHILVSADGKRWSQVPAPVDTLLTSVFFLDAMNGWIVGHDATILCTSDGGKSWKLQNFAPELNQPLLDVRFIDRSRGIAVGAYGLFLETSDGGSHWSSVSNEITAESIHLNAITRLGNGSLLIVGEEGMLALSADDGLSWTRLKSPYSSSMFSVIAQGTVGAVMGGLRGTVYRTDDVASGQWTRIENKTHQSIFGLARLSDGQLVGAGLNATLTRIGNVTAEVIEAAIPNEQGTSGTPEKGALSDVVAWNSGLVTAGDAGISFVSMAGMK